MIINHIYTYYIRKNIGKTFFAIIMMMQIFDGSAQDFCQHWITTPFTDSTSQIWYRKEFVAIKKIKKAFVSIATLGYADLYINGRNASRYYMNPYREITDSNAITTTYDISAFVNSDTITIGVWYSPFATSAHKQHISATIYGKYTDNEAFAITTDNSWICRRATARLNLNNGEDIDGNIDSYSWKNTTDYSLALWQNAEETTSDVGFSFAHNLYYANTINEITSYNYFDATADTICYDFGKGIYGLLRITFRNAHQGEKIYINNNTYICSGMLDEQAIIRFTPTFIRKVKIYGDKNFRLSHIVNIEALNIGNIQTRFW